jgi:chromosome segregation ATPase
LRRAQSALQQAQQQRDGLQAEKATLERAQADHAALAKQQQAQLGAAQSELKRLRALEAEHAALQAQLGTERQTLTAQREQAAADQAQAATRLADANRQTLQLRAERDELLNANRALVGKLEAATVALAEARERNRQLHAVGQDAVDRLRGLSPADRALQGDRILGLTAVRIDNEAEDLLQRLDAQRQPAAAP